MKTDNALFHKGAFKEAAKQLALPVILATAVMIIAQVLFSLVVENTSESMFRYGHVVSVQFMSLPAAVVFLLVTPAMILYVSQYMMKRSAGDLYAAFPVKKESLVFSNLLCVLMYSAVMMAVGIATAEIMTGISRKVSFGVNDWYLVLGAYIAAAVFMSGAMYLALSVTGNHFATISAFLMLLLVPRVTVSVWLALVSEANHTIDNLFNATILDDRLNVITGLFTGPLFHDSFQNLSIKSIVYTLCVGLIYCFIAIKAHKKRPSEIAGYPSVSEKWQAVLRTIPACAVSIIPMIMILDDSKEAFQPEGLYILIMLYLLAILVYFAYELFTTRKLKETLKKAPGLLIVVLFNLIFAGSAVAGQSLIAKDFPDAASVGDINICLNSNRYFKNPGDKDYYAVKMKEYAIKDPEAKELLCHPLSLYQQIYGDTDMRMTDLSLKFSSGTLFKNREFEMTEGDWNKLMKILEKDPSFKAIFTTAIPENEIKSMTSDIYTGSGDLSYAEYTALLNELYTKDFPEVVRSLTSIGNIAGYPGFEITTKDDLVQTVYITPQTPEFYVAYLNDHTDKDLLTFALSDWEEDTKYKNNSEEEGVLYKGLSVIFQNLHPDEITDKNMYRSGFDFNWGLYKNLDEPDEYYISGEDDKITRENIKELNGLLLSQSHTDIRDVSTPYVKVLYRVYLDRIDDIKILEEKVAYVALDPLTAEWAENIEKERNNY